MNSCLRPLAQVRKVFSLRISFVLVLCGFLLTGCPKKQDLPTTSTAQPAKSAPGLQSIIETAPPLYFVNATKGAGLHFRHANGAFGLKMFPETMGSGVVWFDYDNDGWPDLFFVNGREWKPDEIKSFKHRPWSTAEREALKRREGSNSPLRRIIPIHKHRRHTGALYRNNRDGTFSDVTKGSGLDVEIYGLGVAAGDYDGDGYSDLYISAYPKGVLFRNRGQGKFQDVTAQTGVADSGVSTSVAWLDYDADGRLDLFITRYVDWKPQLDVFHSLDGKYKSYSRPRAYKGRVCHLYRNVGAPQRGGAKFINVSNATGIGRQPSPLYNGKLFPLEGNGLGAAIFDWNNDGHLDIAVANDMTPNHLLENDGKGKFKEVGRTAGMALTVQGLVRAGMGIDTADLYNDGHESVLIGNFSEEMLGLWENKGGSLWDVAFQGPIGIASYNFLTFGLSFADLDNDSRQDFITANGHINENVELFKPHITYRQRAQIYLQRQDRFLEVGEQAGPGPLEPVVGRGLACADYDLDGDIDVVISTNGGYPVLLRNDSSARFAQLVGKNLSVRLVLKGRSPNTNAIGTLIRAQVGTEILQRWVRTGSSYLSQSELPATIGLGRKQAIDHLKIRWPTGRVSEFPNLEAGKIIWIDEEKGIVRQQNLNQKLKAASQ